METQNTQTRARARTEGSPLFINFHWRRSSVRFGTGLCFFALTRRWNAGLFSSVPPGHICGSMGSDGTRTPSQVVHPWDRRIAV